MNSKIIGLLAETSLHFGAGRNEGAIDLPVAREAATGYPVLVGSSLKGSLRDAAERAWDGRKNQPGEAKIKQVFGDEDGKGGVSPSDARLLLLPVRSLQSAYKWITCPYILERLRRDAKRCGITTLESVDEIVVEEGKYVGSDNGGLFLEEREFSYKNLLPAGLTSAIGTLIGHDDVRNRLDKQLVVLNDDDFVWFARYGLPVTARNSLDDEKKTSKNLWYEETLPPDTLLYAMLMGLNGKDVMDAMNIFAGSNGKPYLQAGGNETVGQGWLHVKEVCR